MGDVFSVPINNGNFGIGQILKREQPKRNINAFMVLFDKEFTASELKNIDSTLLEGVPVMSGMPLDMFKIWRKDKPWKILTNTTPVYYPIPMFKIWSPDSTGQSIEDATYLIDFGWNYYRSATLDELNRTPIYFTRSSIYFESLLNVRFGNPSDLDIKSYEAKQVWPNNMIIEQEDIVTNAHLYRKWTGFGSHP